MAKERKKPSKRASQPQPPTYGMFTKLFFRLCVAIATIVSIVVATDKALEIFHIKARPLNEKIFFFFVAFCIYIYIRLTRQNEKVGFDRLTC